MQVLLISTYDLGHSPFGLASPAAWLGAEGHAVVCADLSCGGAPREAVHHAGLVAFFLPMHTAVRLAVKAIRTVHALNPRAHLCCYGVYAPAYESVLRGLGVGTILGGEFEEGLRELARRLAAGEEPVQGQPLISVAQQEFVTPDRSTLPALSHYSELMTGGTARPAGYTEASRGCQHLCRHCPIVAVYGGVFRTVQPEVVLADIRQQAAAGAGHITFGDPDFFNDVGHAAAVVEALHAEFPQLTYDVTIKVEHLLRHRERLAVLARTGCVFVTSGVESVDDRVLERLDKGHTQRDFVEVVELMRAAGLLLAPTFVAFTPWTTQESYREMLRVIAELDLVEQVTPIQLAVRLVIPAGSRLLELEEVRSMAGPFDAEALVYPWMHADPEVDRLPARLQRMIQREEQKGATRAAIFRRVWEVVGETPMPELPVLAARATVPYLTEPWFC